MFTPLSTYRVQVNLSFNLSDLNRILIYLSKLGISTIYCAPFFQARAGSIHGYDITDPYSINPEIGSLEEFKKIAEKVSDLEMGWLQDIVPNHMAYDVKNRWLMDVFEKGKHSHYYRFFDVNWNYNLDFNPLEEENSTKGKIMAPVLGEGLDEVLNKKQLELCFGRNGFYIKYYNLEYPLSWPSYCEVLSFGKKFFRVKSDEDADSFAEYRKLLNELKNIEENFENTFDAESAQTFKEIIYQLYSSETHLKGLIDHCIQVINQNPESFKEILNKQFYKLTYWRETESWINYRRFFTINDLICLSIEDRKVFEHYHFLIKSLVDQSYLQGLRIDHIDGLFNPSEYLERLRKLVGKEVFIIVEKILESEENIPDNWPIQGTTGYEFLAQVSHVFTKAKHKTHFTDLYHDFINKSYHFEDLVFNKKMFILKEKMGGELDNLVAELQKLRTDCPKNIKEALAVFMSSFSIYRVYPDQFPLNSTTERVLSETFRKAEKRFPDLEEALNFLRVLFLSQENPSRERLDFIMRTQQFTGPLAAKGIEDTVFYIYNRLISHNEVGDSPDLFGISVKQFHQKMQEKMSKNPLSINATATHDTKRGEDARMRINFLSELPEEWSSAVFSWQEMNRKFKSEISGKTAPESNDEYFIYQSLIGGFPMDGKPVEEFRQRFKDYLIKVVREAKVNTDWSEPNLAYEESLSDFVEKILTSEEFILSFLPLFEKVKSFSIIYSLAQTLLKITVPGIPDIYQGSELWDLSFVDPDNRRPVDYSKREQYLDEMANNFEPNSEFMERLIQSKEDGRIKMFTLYNSLQTRKSEHELFTKGEYLPLTVLGINAENVLAFARKYENRWAVVVVPISVAEISSEKEFAKGANVWKDTSVVIPFKAPLEWSNSFSNKIHKVKEVERTIGVTEMVNVDAFIEPFLANNSVSEKHLLLSEVLEDFPIALMLSKS